MQIKVGDCLAETGRPGRIWKVVKIVTPPNGHAHARLRRTDDSNENLIVSCSALAKDGSYTRTHPGATTKNPTATPLKSA